MESNTAILFNEDHMEEIRTELTFRRPNDLEWAEQQYVHYVTNNDGREMYFVRYVRETVPSVEPIYSYGIIPKGIVESFPDFYTIADTLS